MFGEALAERLRGRLSDADRSQETLDVLFEIGGRDVSLAATFCPFADTACSLALPYFAP